jgi:diphosphomevalonate decarboxylase
LAADPGILYWRGVTVEVIHRVRAARQTQGLAAFFTIDAGPHVKVFCQPQDAARVEALLLDVPGVHGVLKAEVGGPARLLDAQE